MRGRERRSYIVGVWSPRSTSEDVGRAMFEEALVTVGFPPPSSGEITILELHAIEPPL